MLPPLLFKSDDGTIIWEIPTNLEIKITPSFINDVYSADPVLCDTSPDMQQNQVWPTKFGSDHSMESMETIHEIM